MNQQLSAKAANFQDFLCQGYPPTILVIAGGTNRVNEKKLKKLVGGKLKRADADFVREVTGFVIGGVPPAGHIEPLQTFMDLDLLQFSQVWAAAGSS